MTKRNKVGGNINFISRNEQGYNRNGIKTEC